MGKPIRIGIHGSRNTGKTCYYAALYGGQTEGETAIFLATEETVGELERHWKMLEQGQKPEATAMTEQKELNFSVHCAGEKSDVVARDYSGAVVQRGKKDAPELTDDVSMWLRESEALFILIDASYISQLSEDKLKEQQIEIGLLISRLQRWRKLAKPMALVLTKWDLTAHPLLSPAEEVARARAFVEEHKLLGEIVKGVKLSGTDFEIFPVSAFGGHRADDSTLPPEEGLRPFNVLSPLVWCVKRVREIRATRRGRRRRTALVFAVALLAASCWGLDWHANRLFDHVVRIMKDASAPTSEVMPLINKYLTHWNTMTRTHGRKARFHDARQAFQSQREATDFDILHEPEAGMSSSELELLMKDYSEYLEYWAAYRGAEVRKMMRTAESYLPAAKNREAFNGKVADLFNTIEGIPEGQKKLEELNRFIAENPESKLSPDCKGEYDRVKAKRDSVFAELKNAEWQAVKKYCNDNAGRYKDCVDYIDEYLGTSPQPEFKKLAEDKKREIEASWDKENYEKVTDKLEGVSKMKTQREEEASTPPGDVYEAIRKYANQTSPPPAMQDHARVWLEWYKACQNATNVAVSIERLVIKKDGKLDEKWDKDVHVAVQIGNVSYQTTYTGRTNNIVFTNKVLEPFAYQMGNPITVVVTEVDWADPDDVVESSIHPFVRELELTYDEASVGTLYLNFNNQPELPAYETKP